MRKALWPCALSSTVGEQCTVVTRHHSGQEGMRLAEGLTERAFSPWVSKMTSPGLYLCHLQHLMSNISACGKLKTQTLASCQQS